VAVMHRMIIMIMMTGCVRWCHGFKTNVSGDGTVFVLGICASSADAVVRALHCKPVGCGFEYG